MRLCVGVDSHCTPDAFEELRAVELDECSRTERRIILSAPELLAMGTRNGHAAVGMADVGHDDAVHLRRDDPPLAVQRLTWLRITSSTARGVDDVWVGETRIVADGVHVCYAAAYARYIAALASMGLDGWHSAT